MTGPFRQGTRLEELNAFLGLTVLCSVIKRSGRWGQSRSHGPLGCSLSAEEPRPVALGSFSSLIPLPDSCSLPPWKERQFGDFQSEWLSLSGSRLGTIASRWPLQGPAQLGWGKGWDWRRGQWAQRAGGAAPTGSSAVRAAGFLIRSQLKGPQPLEGLPSSPKLNQHPCPLVSDRTSLRA